MSKNIVWRLLRKNISSAQIAGYAIANLVGLAIVLTAIRFYCDINAVWNKDDSFITKDYVIISKHVSGLNLIIGGNTSFSKKEIDEISHQPWAKKIGNFTAANFDVYASLDFNGRGMSTALFFEAIPDEFFDIMPEGWEFDPKNPVIPIIMSKDYLTLYNFGFASSRNLPQLSESIMSSVPLRIMLCSNNGGQCDTYYARIVGFSSRFNTIAVPQPFMEWANKKYAPTVSSDPSRLIIEVNSPGDPAIKKFLDDNNYESAGDKIDNSKASYFLSIVTGVVIAVGAIISLLAFFILLLSIYLLLQKNREKLHNLMLLGYSPRQVARHYYIMIGVVNVAVLVLALVAMTIGSSYWSTQLESLGVESESPLPAILIGIAIMVVVTLGNYIAISRNIHRNFSNGKV